jgi:drug/metabolite transporter (DMT)-like permease
MLLRAQLKVKSPCALRRVILATGLLYYGLQATSAAYSAIFINFVPIVTFTVAVVLRYVCMVQIFDLNVSLSTQVFIGSMLFFDLSGPRSWRWETGLAGRSSWARCCAWEG